MQSFHSLNSNWITGSFPREKYKIQEITIIKSQSSIRHSTGILKKSQILTMKSILFLGVALIAVAYGSSSFNPDKLTKEQAAAVAQFRELVKSENVTENFMNEDYYLAKVLHKAEFNLEQARSLFRGYVQGRKTYKLDTILKEDFGQLRVRFPFTRATFDKYGRPVVYRDLAHGEVNKYLDLYGNEGKVKLARYMLYIMEDAAEYVRQLREQGRNIDKYDYIINAGDFSLEQHIPPNLGPIPYPSTLPIALDIEKLVFINAPKALEGPFSLLDEQLRALIDVYGQDEGPWKEYLAEFLEANQFPSGIFREIKKKDNNLGLLRW